MKFQRDSDEEYVWREAMLRMLQTVTANSGYSDIREFALLADEVVEQFLKRREE